LMTSPAHGSVVLNGDGSFVYQHDGSATSTDSFTYRASDGQTTSAAVPVTMTINNTAPIASGDAYAASRGGTLHVARPGVLANDSDPQQNPLTAALATGPSHGTVTLNADGSFSYHHNNDRATSDSFTYRASNGFGTPVQATVHLTIHATNQPPVANGDVYSVTRGQVLTVDAPGILGNDSDPEGSALTAHVVSGPFHGTLSLGSDGS